MFHYFVPASLNDSHKPINISRPRARKRLMESENITFGQLKQRMMNIELGKGKSKQSYDNLVSALNALMLQCNVDDENNVSSILRLSFFRNRSAHTTLLADQGKSPAYIANRKTYLGKWHKLVIALDREYSAASGQASPFVNVLKDLLSNGFSQKRFAEEAGISLASLQRWLAGARPNERARPSISRIERFFGIAKGELLTMCGLAGRCDDNATEDATPKIRYRERLKETSGDCYALKDISPQLREEWVALVKHKTAHTSFIKSRQKNGRWSFTNEKVFRRTEKNWYAFQGENYVVSAGMKWSMISLYLGWLMRPVEQGGPTIRVVSNQTLAHLTNCDLLSEYTNWRIHRAEGKVHGGVTEILVFVKSLCHPKTGYFCNTNEFSEALSIEPSEWQERCKNAFEFCKETLNDLHSQREFSRDSFEPLKLILELDNPMDAVADAIQRINADRPSTGGTDEAIWARDKLLLKILSSNPLRAKNLKMLKIFDPKNGRTLSGTDTGLLYRTKEGGWRISIPKKVFKNFAGAAKDRDYDMPVHESIWTDIDNYLTKYRPLICCPENPYLFTSSRNFSSVDMMFSLNRRVEALSRQYFWRCPGFGPHGFRHIVATAILKMSPNDWQTAALVLHDREETVRNHYAHLRSNDGATRQFEILASSYMRM